MFSHEGIPSCGASVGPSDQSNPSAQQENGTSANLNQTQKQAIFII
jgi:hypothetical protein